MQIRIAHRPERGRKALTAHDRGTTTDLEGFEVGVVAHDAQRAVTELRLEVGLPQVRRLEDVAVGVDGTVERESLRLVHRLLCHFSASIRTCKCSRSCRSSTWRYKR